jgi:hypothetical protein
MAVIVPPKLYTTADDNILHSPSTNEAKERVKFEAQYSAFGPGLRPYIKRQYPMMMHLAGPPEGGMGATAIIDQIVVDSEHESEFPYSRGFRDTPLDAILAYEAQQLEFAKLAANLEYQKKNQLSPRAAAEVEAAQDAHPTHLPMVPETPVKPRAK